MWSLNRTPWELGIHLCNHLDSSLDVHGDDERLALTAGPYVDELANDRVLHSLHSCRNQGLIVSASDRL